MSSGRVLFKDIPCPMGSECDALCCWFSHPDRSVDVIEADDSKVREGNLAKRLKVAPRETPKEASKPVPAFVGTLAKKQKPPIKTDDADPSKTNNKAKVDIPSPKTPAAADRKEKSSQKSPNPVDEGVPERVPIKHTTESLNPRMLSRAPAGHQQRRSILLKLHESLEKLNGQVTLSQDSSTRALALAPAQLIMIALDEEEKVATEDFQVYANVIRSRILKYQKMTMEQWKIYLLELTLTSGSASLKNTYPINGERILETGLSESEERQILHHLIAKQHGLEQHGYVTGAPTDEEIMAAKAGVETAKGWEVCQRCQCRFQVFLDRRLEDGAFTNGGSCTHHPGRVISNGRMQPKTHGCCNEAVGRSIGCSSSPCHVFKVSDPRRLATVMQYTSTPDNPAVTFDKAVSIDCEMGFTVLGFELLRMTVLSWPKADRIIDVLVRPFGDVLDLNTRFSGVTAEQFLEAKPYDPESEGELQILGSPKEAQDLLFKHIGPSTPIVGHALDNDLSALRLIHPCIVDTALLLPHKAGLPFRRSLKSLARDYIHRVIQDAGIAGHDSGEDAKAAGDIVLELVKRKWRKMTDEGWKAENGKLVPPKILPPQSRLTTDAVNQQRAQEESGKQAEAHRMEEARRLNERFSRKRTFGDTQDAEVTAAATLNYD